MSDYERIARLIAYLRAHYREQPSLEQMAEWAGVSVPYLHRLFQRWAATTPKAFLRQLTAMASGQQLRRGASVLDTSLSVGLSGPGRLHDLCVRLEAASPGEIKSGGRGLNIRTGFATTPFGEAFFASSQRGLMRLAFVDADASEHIEPALRSLWPNAAYQADAATAANWAERLFCEPGKLGSPSPLSAYVTATSFQCRVWQALLEIPSGQLTTYGAIAAAIGKPTASRAVGSAVGDNPIAFLIPCHRVILASGAVGNYHWGRDRKLAMIAREHHHAQRAAST